MKKTIYLANPYGFSEQQNRLLLPLFVEALESLGLEVWEPFERNNQEANHDSQAGHIASDRPTSKTSPTPMPPSQSSTVHRPTKA